MLFLGLILGRLNGGKIWAALRESAYRSTTVFVIAIGGKLFVNFIALTGTTTDIAAWIETSSVSVLTVMALIVVMYILLDHSPDPSFDYPDCRKLWFFTDLVRCGGVQTSGDWVGDTADWSQRLCYQIHCWRLLVPTDRGFCLCGYLADPRAVGLSDTLCVVARR